MSGAAWRGRLDRDRVALPLTAIALLALFGLTFNPWWVPTGDSEVFLVAARNLARGDGLTYLGEPLRVAPPGWPIVLAGELWLGGGRVAILKLGQIAFMTGGLLLAYAGLRRAAALRPAAAMATTLLAAICSPLYPLTFWLHSDALFVLVGSAAIVAATGGRSRSDARDAGAEAPNQVARAAPEPGASAPASRSNLWFSVTIALVVAGVVVRWAGAPYAAVVAGAALAAGRGRAIVVLVAGGAAFGLVYALVHADGGGGGAMLATAEVGRVPELLVRERPDLSVVGEVVGRLLRLPDWLGWALFAPMRFLAFGVGLPGVAVNRVVGWLAIGLLGVAAVRDLRRGQGLYAGVLAYVAALSIAWPFPNPRYVVPILPFAIAGVISALGTLAAWRWSMLWRGLRWAFIAAIVATNGAMWAVDVWVARAESPRDFYNRYEAGIHLPLIEAAWSLRNAEGPIAVSRRYENLRERWNYEHAGRVVAYLADKPSLAVPNEHTGWGVKPVQNWARANDVAWYVHQSPTVPGRVWHFRLTREEHAAIMGDLPGPPMNQFSLYKMVDHAKPNRPPLLWLEGVPAEALGDAELRRVAGFVPHLDAVGAVGAVDD